MMLYDDIARAIFFNDNVSKGKKESITLDILLERIRVWDSKYLVSGI